MNRSMQLLSSMRMAHVQAVGAIRSPIDDRQRVHDMYFQKRAMIDCRDMQRFSIISPMVTIIIAIENKNKTMINSI
jgi:hypothetical protein